MIQTGIESRVKVHELIEGQLPEFILDQSPKTVDFLQQYYRSQEYQGGPIDLIDNLDQYLSLDQLTPQVIVGVTSLTAAANSSDDTIQVVNTRGFPNEYGLLKIDDEIITYTGLTTNTFTGCVRGFSGITSYHSINDSEELVFDTSVAANHDNESPVQNLSSLFLKEFYKKVKYSYAPGLEDVSFIPELDVGNFIKEARTFYQSKGTEESFRILYKILFGVTPTVIDLESYLLKPSDAEFIRREVVLVERISGDVNQLVGQTIYSKTNPRTKAAVSEIEILTRNNKTYYKLALFIGYSNQDLIEGDFDVTSSTKSITKVSAGSSVITVDSTVGFPESGTVFSGINTITYTDKTINQFLNCSGIDNDILATDDIRSDEIIFGYENGDFAKLVELRVAAIISDINLSKDAGLALENEKISIKELGDVISNPIYSDSTDKQRFANSWIYNTSSSYECSDIDNSSKQFTLKSSIDKASLKINDRVDIINDSSKEIKVENAKVTAIAGNEVTLEYTGFTTDASIPHSIRRVPKKTTSKFVPLQYSDLFSDIQNVYSEDLDEGSYGDECMYVASNSLPSYTFRQDTIPSTPSIVVGTAVTFIGAGSTESGALLTDVGELTYSIINFPTQVPFLTGDEVVYEPESDAIIGLDTGKSYYVRVLPNKQQIKLYASNSFIQGDLNLEFEPLLVGIGGKHTFTLRSVYQKQIQPQKLLRKFPLIPRENDGQDTTTETVGMMINGVEIKNYKSQDKIYSGPLSSITVVNSGTGYDVINPPVIEVANTGAGATALVRPVLSGSVEKILVDPQTRELDKVISVSITGGGPGNGVALQPVVEERFISASFDARLLTFGGGIGESAETITFLGDHNFADGEEVVYRTNGNPALGIGTFAASNADQNRFLVENTKYIAEFVNSKTIRLYNSTNDFRTGINTIGFTTTSNSGIHRFRTFNGKKTLKDVKVLEGGSNYQNRVLNVKPVGISTIDHLVNFKNHGFQEGDLIEYQNTGTVISGLVTTNQYYVFKNNNDQFRVADAGVGGTVRDNFDSRLYIKLDSIGSGFHQFKYPDIKLNINVSFGDAAGTGVITATPYVRGNIIDAYLFETGTGYGSTTLNFERSPSVSIKNGKGASLYPVVVGGQLIRVDVRSRGSEYFSVPDVTVVGDGSGAVVRPIIRDGQLIEVVVISGGTNYTQDKTSLSIVSAGKNAILSSNVRFLTINDAERHGSEYLYPTLKKGLEYVNLSYSNDIASNEFNDTGASHSPIIGYAYDGHPIYGPYGFSDPLDTSSGVRILETGYKLDSSIVEDRPEGFADGFFIEDYTYDATGDLDIHNTRFCKTPEYPNGTYAYFAGIATDGTFTPKFPYFVGKKFRSLNQLDGKDQSFDLNSSDLVRNTFPHQIGVDGSRNDFVIESQSFFSQESSIESVTKGSITSVDIRNKGVNYKVDDLINFDNTNTNGGGASARISEIEGKTVLSIASSITEFSDCTLLWDRGSINVKVNPFHSFQTNDVISISGLSTFVDQIAGLRRVAISTENFNIYQELPANGSSGIMTDIYVSSIPKSVSIGSTIGIGTEVLSVLNIFNERGIIRAKRGVTGTAHATNTRGFVYPNTIKIDIDAPFFESSLNEKIFFNPTESVGVGSTAGVENRVEYPIGDKNYDISIPNQSIFLPKHPFKTGERVILRKNAGGSSISVANTESSATFDIGDTDQSLFVINKSEDLIGIVTQSGLTTSTNGLFFFSNGSDNYEYSLEPTKNKIICVVQKNDAVIAVSTAHNLQPDDQIKLKIKPSRSVGIGSSTQVRVKYNFDIEKIVIDPIGFTSTAINTLDNIITLNNHPFITGEKIYYNATDEVATGLEPGLFYVYKVDKNRFQLALTYEDSVASPPKLISIGSTGGAEQEFSAINPRLLPTKGNDLVFDLSDSTLQGFKFNLYTDQLFSNQFVSVANTTTFSTSGVGTVGVTSTASFTLKYTDSLVDIVPDPTQPLFYNVERGGFISTADSTVIDYNQITFEDSKYDGSYSVIGVGTTSFVISLLKDPELELYTPDITSSMEYTTTSKTASGPIAKIQMISEGNDYKQLPGISSITTLNGSDAILFAQSPTIGKIKQIRVIDQAFEYNTDKTIRPEANIPSTLELRSNLTITDVEILNGGTNYTTPPDIAIVDSITGERIDDGILTTEVQSSSVSSVNVFELPSGLNFNSKNLFTVNNSNGVGISTMQTSTSGIVTCFLTTPLLGFSTNPFTVGEQIFVEGITQNGIGGSGFNSEDYGFRFFEVISYENLIPAKLKFSVAGLTTNPGLADTTQGSFATIVKRSEYPVFKVTQGKSKFTQGEQIFVNGQPTDLNVTTVLPDYIKTSGKFQVKSGDTVRGVQSGSTGTISRIIKSDAKFDIDFSVRSNKGWKKNTGQLNNDIQVLPDNDYYQTLSYSVKSPIQYQDSIDVINRLVHTTGLKNFVDVGIATLTQVGVAVTTVKSLIFTDIIDESRVDTIFGFAQARDADVQLIENRNSSKFLEFRNKSFVDSVICKTNRVLVIDDVSKQFTNKENVNDSFIDLDESGKDFARYLVQVRSTDNLQNAVHELIVLHDPEFESVFTLRKGYLSKTATNTAGYEYNWTEDEFAELTGFVDAFDVLSLRFTPNDVFNIDYDVKLIKDTFNGNVIGVASTSIGLIKNQSTNAIVGVGSTNTILEYDAGSFDAMHVHLHLNANDLITQNYTELYIHHDGTDTYVSDYYFDSDSAQGFSGNDFSNFDAGITTEGKLRLSYTNPLTVPVTVRANAVGFGATSYAYTVTVASKTSDHYYFGQGSGKGYYIIGGQYNTVTQAPVLEFVRGLTYTFEQNDTSNNTHAIYFSEDPDAYGGTGRYETGVVYRLDGVVKTYSQYVSGFIAATTRSVTITVAEDAPNSLNYACQAHAYMGAPINVTGMGDGALRFKTGRTQADGDERSSFFSGNSVVGTGETAIFTASVDTVNSIKSLVSVSYGSTYALHQILTLSPDSTDTYSTQYPFLSVGSTTGIGTFGAVVDGSDVAVKFYPDSSITGIVTIKSFNEVLYQELDQDGKEGLYENINYGSIKTQEYKIGLFDATNSSRINKTSFRMDYQDTPIFQKFWDPANTTILNKATGEFNITNHFFETGEELIYRAGTSVSGVTSTSIGIGATADSIGIVTNKLPYQVYAIKVNNEKFRIATRPEYATAGISVTFTDSGTGNNHSFEMVKKLEKAIISIDDVIQAPIAYTPIVYDLEANGGQIGTATTVFSMTGISSIFNGDILKVEDEFMKVGGVGLGTTSVGPISDGDVRLIEVVRGAVGTAATAHADGTSARIYRGSYNFSGQNIFFTNPPKGSGLVTVNESNLPKGFSEFNGRVFLRKDYTSNLIYDDISNQFTGVAQTFTVSNSGVNTTGIETGSGLVLLNGIFQTPTTDNNAGNNYFFKDDGSKTEIVFTGITSTDGTPVVSLEDPNQNAFPKGGLIVSIGSTNGLGFAPLIGADVLPIIGAGGSISGIIGIPTFTTPGYSISTASYDFTTGILDITTGTAHNLNAQNDDVYLEDLKFTSALGITTYGNSVLGNIFPITQIVDSTKLKVKIGITTFDQTYVGFGTVYPYYNSTSRAFGSGYNGRVAIGVSVYEPGHTGNNAVISAEVLTNEHKYWYGTSNNLYYGGQYTHTFDSASTGAVNVQSGAEAGNQKTPSSASYDPITGDMTLAFASPHGMSTSDTITLDDGSISFKCARDNYATVHAYPRPHDPISGVTTAVTVSSTTAFTLNVGRSLNSSVSISTASYEPSTGDLVLNIGAGHGFTAAGILTCSDASYNPSTGVLTVTTSVPHGMVTGERVQLAPNSFTFTCAKDNNKSEHYYPREDDPASAKWLAITKVDADTFTVVVGTSSDTSAHTFVGAQSGNIRTDGPNGSIGIHTRSLTFTCAQDNHATFHSYPRATDPIHREVLGIGATTTETITVNAGTSVNGTGGQLKFTIVDGGTGYVNPDVLVDEPSYTNLDIKGTFRRGIGQTSETGVNELINLKLGPNSKPIFENRFADAGDLIDANKLLIADISVGEMLKVYPSFSVPGGPQNCKDDVIDVLEAVAFNLRFGGNDEVWNAANLYITGAHVAGEEQESIYVFHAARDLANKVINNVAVAKSDYTVRDQVFDLTITADPAVGYNTDPGGCANVQSAINSFVGIVTSAIGFSTVSAKKSFAPAQFFEVSDFSIKGVGYAFELGDKFQPIGLVTAKGLKKPITPFEIEVVDVFNDRFASWQFGQLDFIDPIENLQDSVRTVFPLLYNAELVSFQLDKNDNDSKLIDIDAVLVIFINGVLQEPKEAYIFDGGSSVQFLEAPKPEDKISIFFYNGTREIDSVETDIAETVKVGDTLSVRKAPGISTSVNQSEGRIVYDIATSDRVETNVYADVGIDAFNDRTVNWTKQKRDLFINGRFVSKARDSIEGMVFPTSRIIRDVNVGDTDILLDNAQFFNYEENESSVVTAYVDAVVIDDIPIVGAAATATIDSSGQVTATTVTNPGFGYTTATVEVKYSSPKNVGVGIGTTATGTATIVNGSVSVVSVANPGFGYTNSLNVPVAPQIIIPQPRLINEVVTNIQNVQGNTGIITGITTVAGIGTDLAIKFFTDNTLDLQVGYHIVVTDTTVGSGVTSIYTHDNDIIGVGTEFVDNVYRVHQIPIANEIVCNIASDTITTGIQTLGTSIYNPNGYYSWGRLTNFVRNSEPISIGVSGRTVTSGLSTYPLMQRRGYGLRDNGAIRKILPD